MKLVYDILLLNSSHPTTTEVHAEFGLLGSHVCDGEAKWGCSFKVLGESFFTKGYWEWVDEVLGRHEPFLKGFKLYEAIFASLFSYEHHAFVIRAYCECWCPTTNTLHTSIGEVSISLWDLYYIARLPIIRSFYDEMVRAWKSYLMMQQSPHSHQVVEIYSLHIIEFALIRKGSLQSS